MAAFGAAGFPCTDSQIYSLMAIWAMALPDEWPVVEGRYVVGKKDAPVAVCTLGTLDIGIPMGSVAIRGKCVIENIGIEKVVKNVVSNPNIRFLILCGAESKGHFTGQALVSLKENGVDAGKRIIGAKGAMPFLKGLSIEEIEAFRRQVEVVDMVGEMNPDAIAKAAGECAARNPGPFGGAALPAPGKEKIERIDASPSDAWDQDPKGFFIINVNREKGDISAEHYTNNRVMRKVIVGKTAEGIYKKMAALGMVSLQPHAFYLGKELARAEAALRAGQEYIQE